MLIGSTGTDAASALARDHSGTVKSFVKAMNARAKELGMRDSVFRNPTGLPHKDQFSTARDVAILAKAIDDSPILRTIVAAPVCELPRSDGTTTRLTNTNKLLHTTAVCDGMKTGFTRASGHCLVASGSFGQLRRIVVVLNSTAEQIWSDAGQLLARSLSASRIHRRGANMFQTDHSHLALTFAREHGGTQARLRDLALALSGP